MIVVLIEPLQIPNLRDPKDAIIIASALAGGSEIIVSGDQDLLVLEEVAGIKILSPKDFLIQY